MARVRSYRWGAIALALAALTVCVSANGAVSAPSADLSVGVSGPGVGAPGGTISIRIVASNRGPDVARSVIVRNHLTNGSTTFVSMTAPTGWSCVTPAVGSAADDLSCSVPELAAGAVVEFALVLRIVPSFTGSISESARITSSTADPSSGNDFSTTSVQSVAQADLSVSVAGPPSAPAGTFIEYAITVRNNGPGFAQNLTLTNVIPSQTTYLSWRGTAFSCTYSSTSNQLTCHGGLGIGGSGVVYLSVLVDKTASGTITNRARAIYSNDPNAGNNEAALALSVTHPRADLAVTTRGPDSVAPGDTPLYAIDLTNLGPDIAYVPQVTIGVPAQTTVTGVSSSSAWGCAIGLNNTWTCGTAEMAPGATTTVFLSVRVATTATGSISVTGSGSSASTDPNPGNDADTHVSAVAGVADVAVAMSGPAKAAPDTDITYTATVTNRGPSKADQVSAFFEDYPGTFVSIQAPTGWECNGPDVGGTSPAGCNAATLAADASADIALTIHVDPDAVDTISNFVTVSSLRDPEPANDDARVDTVIADVAADLDVQVEGPALASPGSDLTYTITVANDGPDPATAVIVNDLVPVQTTFVSFDGPAGWECSTPAVGTRGYASCLVGELASGAVETMTLVVRADTGAAGTISDTASVASDTPDPDWGNNTSTVTTTVGPTTAAPGAPTLVSATAGDNRVTLTWSAPDSDGGSALTGYDVYAATTAGGQSATPLNATPLPANAATYLATGLVNGTTYYFTVKALNAVGHSAPSNEVSAVPFATTALQYNGTQIVNVGASVTPAALLSSSAAGCRSGRLVSFALDTNPLTGAAAEYSMGASITSLSGQASAPAVLTGGWLEGVYTVTASVEAVPGCAASSDSATLTVASPGTAASGAGWYSLSGSGRVSFGFTVRLVAGTVNEYAGTLVVINPGKWRLKARLTTYARTSGGEGAAAGSGDLYWWNTELNGGLGEWELARTGVSFTIGFTATGSSKKATPGTFGIRIDYTPVAPEPSTLPSSAPELLKAGSIKLA